MIAGVTARGIVTARLHPSGWAFDRAAYRRARIAARFANTVTDAGLAYLTQMLLADPVTDPRRYGLTMIGASDASGERLKLDLTDQYASGSQVTNVLYVSSGQPLVQPVDLLAATLYADEGGAVAFAQAAFPVTVTKSSNLALTLEWVIAFTAGGSSVSSRSDVPFTTASLAANASGTGAVLISVSYKVLRITTDRPARVRLYQTAAQRDADLSRAFGVSPEGEHGLILDVQTSVGDLSVPFSPLAIGVNLDAVPTANAYYTVQNLSGATSPVTVTAQVEV